MTKLDLFIDDATERRLRAVSKELGRTVEELASSAVAETVLCHFRHAKFDPADYETQQGYELALSNAERARQKKLALN